MGPSLKFFGVWHHPHDFFEDSLPLQAFHNRQWNLHVQYNAESTSKQAAFHTCAVNCFQLTTTPAIQSGNAPLQSALQPASVRPSCAQSLLAAFSEPLANLHQSDYDSSLASACACMAVWGMSFVIEANHAASCCIHLLVCLVHCTTAVSQI